MFCYIIVMETSFYFCLFQYVKTISQDYGMCPEQLTVASQIVVPLSRKEAWADKFSKNNTVFVQMAFAMKEERNIVWIRCSWKSFPLGSSSCLWGLSYNCLLVSVKKSLVSKLAQPHWGRSLLYYLLLNCIRIVSTLMGWTEGCCDLVSIFLLLLCASGRTGQWSIEECMGRREVSFSPLVVKKWPWIVLSPNPLYVNITYTY